MKPSLAEIGNLLGGDSKAADRHMYGQIQSVITDASGKVTGYEVSMGGESDTMTCRKLSGANIGDTVMVTLLASGVAIVTGTVNGDADALQALSDASNAYEVGSAERRTFYAYANNASGLDFSLTDTSLPYRGICITTDATAPTQPAMYKWEVNPLWASKHAEKYLHEITDGLAIYSEDLGEDTYAGLSALALTFYLAGIQQMRVGYDASLQEYGVIAESLVAAGSGAGVKFDNTENATTRGRFVQEIRDNGHWSIKKY